MAFTRSASGARVYIKYSDYDDGDVLVEGYYVGEETSKFKNQVYIFRQAADDNVVCLNAAGKLTKWIDNDVQTGDLVQVIYKGKKPMTGGQFAGKEAHDFELSIDHDHRKKYHDGKGSVSMSGAKKVDTTSKAFNVFADEAL